MVRQGQGEAEFPQKQLETAFLHSLRLMDQNREYLQMHLAPAADSRAAQALDDPLYREQPNTMPAGESIVWALAKAQGVPQLRYPAEDARYEEPLLRDAGLLPTLP